jgi:hypothetical protein
LLYINIKEGFAGPGPSKVQLIPVSTIDTFYNNLTDPVGKEIVAPLVELYKLFVANYDDAFDVSLQIIAANQEVGAAVVNVKPATTQSPGMQPGADMGMQPGVDMGMQPGVDMDMQPGADMGMQPGAGMGMTQAQRAVRNTIIKKWAPIINPGISTVLTNAIKWLPRAKQFYDKFVSNNYYGLMSSGPPRSDPTTMSPIQLTLLTITTTLINTLYANDQLSILFGPTFAKTNPNFPIVLPATNDQFVAFLNKPSSQEPLRAAQINFGQYVTNARAPFVIIHQYVTQNLKINTVNDFMKSNVISDTIIKLIDQLNQALASDVTDQATIGELTGKLDVALANDATDQATITNLQGKVDKLTAKDANLKTQQSMLPTQWVLPKPTATTKSANNSWSYY